ncbi:hypothetical protein [Sutcliffiella horikoshii]|uniref:hypothetical protein n=1 Tax=Sutcliffiella horikoshii TaxID=79883 RepID=UPI001CC05E41|nr:hypothetical protein [Sutcliffiella horikoshii]UAL45883.1 hypothetical protein K7887_13130 [Sutcliffiella horikoshii]
MMEKRLYIIIAILFLSFPCLAYGEVAHSFPLSSDTISAHNDMQIEPAVQAPSTNGWQKKKKDITSESSSSFSIDIHHFPYKHSIREDISAKPHLFLTPYFYQGGYLSFTVI